MKDNLNEHDMTKKMMDVMRGGYKSKLLTEFTNAPSLSTNNPVSSQGNDVEPKETEDVITPKQGDVVFNEELKKLQTIVKGQVKITNFKIYPNDENVLVEGVLLNGITFKMDLINPEIEINMNNISLTDKVDEVLGRLRGYHENFIEEWSDKLTKEYPPKND